MKIIAANWKMNGDFEFTDRFVREINSVAPKNVIVICPPAILIGKFRDFRHQIGAQNCFWKESGAFTGENSPRLLREAGCRYVILGHSERRSIFHETDDIIFEKYKAAAANDLIPIICVGEKDPKNREEVLERQLAPFLKEPLRKAIFAYEPVWSIGTGITPTRDETEFALEFLRNRVGDVPLLYGGSVNGENAAGISQYKNADGLLVGGAGLKIEEFKKIILI
ncbi:MAG: triose-phosphate isomerase [Holosporaceae bacterium]|jgi:triosephosphate isomerase|nr:triose-phosphate isomerase [Holosporaceae bacterium]